MSDSIPPQDDDRAELQQAMLAAFGDDAMELLDNDEHDDDIPPEIIAKWNSENAAADSPTPNQEWLPVQEVAEDASPLIRYMHQLNQTIYGCGVPGQSSGVAAKSKSPRYLVFSIGRQQFGLPLSDVREIARYPKVTELPCTPGWVRGVTNLRGQILSVMDLRQLLELSCERPVVGEKIVVIYSQQHSATTALVVDCVHGIRSVDSDLCAPDQLSERVAAIAVGTAPGQESATIMIDSDRLLECENMLAVAGSF